MRALLLVVAVLCSCWSVEPQWFTTPVRPEGSIAGVGSGPSPELARMRATAEVVGALVVDIASARASTVRQQTADGATSISEDYQQAIRMRSAISDLAGVEILHQEAVDGVHYCQVAIAESRLVPVLIARLGTLAPSSAERPTPPTWAWVRDQRAALVQARERDALAAILRSRGVEPVVSGASAATLRANLGLAGVEAMQLDGADPALVESVKALLTERGLPIAADAPLTCTVSGTVTTTQTERGWHRCRVSLDLALAHAGRQVGVLAVAGEGTSTDRPDVAARAAFARLNNDLHQAGEDRLLAMLLAHTLE